MIIHPQFEALIILPKERTMSIESNAESLASALANLREEKSRWLTEEAKSKEAFHRKRERHDRERQLLARMADELNKSRESFQAARTQAGASMEKMAAAVKLKESVENKFEAREADMEQRRVTRHGGEAVKAAEAEALMKEMKRNGEEMTQERASAAVKKIEQDLRGGNGSFARVIEELRSFERDEKLGGKNDADGSGTGLVAGALDAIDAFQDAVVTLEQNKTALGDARKNVEDLVRRVEVERNVMTQREG